MDFSLSLILDIVLLLFLAVMIFYAVRLSSSLNAFKRSRSEFEQLIGVLSGHIDQANKSIEALKRSSEDAGAGLQEHLSEAHYVLDELRQVNAVSDSLATRLETAAQQGRQGGMNATQQAPVEAVKPPANVAALKTDKPAEPAAKKPEPAPWQNSLGVKMRGDGVQKPSEQDTPAFAIRDTDFQSAQSYPVGEEGGSDQPSFSSQAERDLYEALKGRKGA